MAAVQGDTTSLFARDVGAALQGKSQHAKYWPPVGRVDNVYGDKNLHCTCDAVETYAAKA